MKKNLTLILVFIYFIISAETWNYEIQKITIPAGNTDEEIFVEKAVREDMLDVGPTEFMIDDKGNIFVLDRNRIKQYDAKGNFLNSTAESKLVLQSFVVHNNMIWAICGNQKNEVYLRRFNADGHVIDTYQIENRKSSLEINQYGKVGLKLSYERFLEFSIIDDKLETKETKYFNDVIFDFNLAENVQDIILLENNKRIDLRDLWPKTAGFYFAGFDKKGNLYFELFNAERDAEIAIISNHAEIYATNIFLPNYSKSGLELGEGISSVIASDGSVFQMIPTTEKIEIIKWTRIEK